MPNPAAAARPHDVTRLIVASISRVEGSVMDQLFAIRDTLSLRAGPRRVHAALLHASGWFVLWLEGTAAAVEAERERAAQDKRNSNQMVIHRSTGPALLDESFTVSITQGPDTPSAFARRVFQVRDEMRAGVTHAPEDVWKQLQSPGTVSPSPGSWRRPDRQVALVAGDDTPSVETLRRLGERFSTPVVYQRFAGPRNRTVDVGAAYVDIANGQQVHRVRLLGRRSLGRAMLRRCLASADGVVVLVGERPSAAVSLAATIATAVRSLHPDVVIYLLARTGAIAASFAQLLRQSVGPALVQDIVALPEARLLDVILGMPSQGRAAAVAREAA